MPDSFYQPNKTVILTGAGFTKPYGGYLGSEMWAAILNEPEIQSDSELRKIMINADGLNYEAAYQDVQDVQKSENFSEKQKKSFTSAVYRVYQRMDNTIRTKKDQRSSCCRSWLNLFAGLTHDPTSRGFFFTLNQDLFVERFYTNVGDPPDAMFIPGLSTEWFTPRNTRIPFERPLQLPSAAALEAYREESWAKKGSGRFAYVKLHGSFGWQSEDGSDAMVIGHGKEGTIEKEPLLKWYKSLFKDVLSAGSRKLLVIGYGFADKHINEVIADAISSSELKLYVVCPSTPHKFMESLCEMHGNTRPIPEGRRIWNGLSGYFPGDVMDFYNQNDPQRLAPRAEVFFQALGVY